MMYFCMHRVYMEVPQNGPKTIKIIFMRLRIHKPGASSFGVEP